MKDFLKQIFTRPVDDGVYKKAYFDLLDRYITLPEENAHLKSKMVVGVAKKKYLKEMKTGGEI